MTTTEDMSFPGSAMQVGIDFMTTGKKLYDDCKGLADVYCSLNYGLSISASTQEYGPWTSSYNIVP